MSLPYRFGHIARIIKLELNRPVQVAPGLHVGSRHILKQREVPINWLEANYGHSKRTDSIRIKLYYQA